MKKKNYKKRVKNRMRTQAKQLATIKKIAASNEEKLGYCRYKYHFLLQDSIRAISLAVSIINAFSRREIDADFKIAMDKKKEKIAEFLRCLELGKY